MADKKKKLLKIFLIRIPFALILGTGLLIATLKLVERYPDPLKEGFEKFLSEKFEANATIGKLEKIKFFPNLDINLSNLTIHAIENAAVISTEVEKFEISVPFTSMVSGNSKLRQLNVIGLKSLEGVITPQKLKIDSLKIIDKPGPEQYGSFVIAEGYYAEKKMLLEGKIEKKGSNYLIPKEIPFMLNIGDYKLHSLLVKRFSKVYLENSIFIKGKKESSSRQYILFESKKYNKDNPLSCLFMYGDSEECSVYFEKEN